MVRGVSITCNVCHVCDACHRCDGCDDVYEGVDSAHLEELDNVIVLQPL